MLTIFEEKIKIFFKYDNYFDHKGIIGLTKASLSNQCIKKRKKDATVEPRRPYLTRVFIGLTKALKKKKKMKLSNLGDLT